MRSAPNFGDLLLDRRPSHFVPPEMRERRLRVLPSASGSGPVSFARRVRTPTTWPAVHLTRWWFQTTELTQESKPRRSMVHV